MAKNPEQALVGRRWETFAAANAEKVSMFGVAVTAEHFHMPSGTDRGAIYINVQSFAIAALFVGCNAVCLSTYHGGESVDEIAPASFVGGRPFAQEFMTRRVRAEECRVDVRPLDYVEGFPGEVEVLDIMVNYDEVVRWMREEDCALNSASNWAKVTDVLVKESLIHISQEKPKVLRKSMKKLVDHTDFIKPKLLDPPIVY